MTEKILKSGIVYSIPERTWENLLWRMPDMNFGEEKKHDPLVMCAALFNGSLEIEERDRIQILKSIFRSRHQAEERLWSGDDLFTEKVNSLVKVWPDCNIAYTEKTIIVSNKADKRFRFGQQEAIYTFYLPEGGVVTSLSLWVNDKEEKAILTTKEKADAAYKTIVGVEQRDPSVVHWQEGNRVTLRVFPVLSGESRKFKIGITAPLERAKGKLVYENIYFDGPDKSKAKESIDVDFEQPAEGFQLPVTFVSKSSQSYSKQGSYEPFWNLVFPDKGLMDCSFSFDGSTYSLKSYHKKLMPVTIEDIYLDVNRSWTRAEFDKVIEKTGNKNIYMYDKDVVKVTRENKDQLFEELNKNEFSLFPLYKLKDPRVSLLITKGSTNSCNIDDLERTSFMDQTKKFLAGNQKIKLFNIGEDLSPYLKSLKEYRIFHYDYGDPEILSHILSENLFVEDIENDDRVIIHKTDMVIEKSGGSFSSAGPDHIMRLFAYNHIMQKIGTGLIMNRPIEDELVAEARKAYVVSPVSSLVVLETEKDYKRFDITDSENSLKNASLNSKGAVPEPHEWILIIIGVLLIVYIKFQPKLKWVKS
jgi:Vault protein inter-alpha-trypsin.